MTETADYQNERVLESDVTDASCGTVRWSPAKSIWWTVMFMGWCVGGSLYFSWAAVGVFLLTSGVTLCFGHSLGMHRKLIHDSYDCNDALEKLWVWLAVLVGLGGPFTMMRTHDVRDWAQRQAECHPFLSHQSGVLRDAWWQIHCKLHFDHPPGFRFPDKLTLSRFYRFIEATSMLQQLPLGLVLFVIGGWGFVFWGICGRVAVSIFGHWGIGYIAHNQGHREWHVKGAAVQGHNVRFCGLITFGECWHNNHHAFPGSARMGLYAGQSDPGWWVLKALESVGWVRHLKGPRDLPTRREVHRI